MTGETESDWLARGGGQSDLSPSEFPIHSRVRVSDRRLMDDSAVIDMLHDMLGLYHRSVVLTVIPDTSVSFQKPVSRKSPIAQAAFAFRAR